MTNFAANTRNVHKELKETLVCTGKVMTQYIKVKERGIPDTAATQQTKEAPVKEVTMLDRPKCECSEAIAEVKELIKRQSEEINELAAQMRALQQKQQQSQDHSKATAPRPPEKTYQQPPDETPSAETAWTNVV